MTAVTGKAQIVIGRDKEVAAIDAFLADLRRGGRALLLTGAAGIGKTALWRVALDQASARGYRLLTFRAAEGESHFGLAALAELLAPVIDEVLPALPQPQARALEIRDFPGSLRGRPA